MPRPATLPFQRLEATVHNGFGWVARAMYRYRHTYRHMQAHKLLGLAKSVEPKPFYDVDGVEPP